MHLSLKGSGDLSRLQIDESLLAPGEGEIIADLIIAAHADAKRKLEAGPGRDDARGRRAPGRNAGHAAPVTP